MAQMNFALSGIETIMLPTAARWAHLSSTMIREVAKLGGRRLAVRDRRRGRPDPAKMATDDQEDRHDRTRTQAPRPWPRGTRRAGQGRAHDVQRAWSPAPSCSACSTGPSGACAAPPPTRRRARPRRSADGARRGRAHRRRGARGRRGAGGRVRGRPRRRRGGGRGLEAEADTWVDGASRRAARPACTARWSRSRRCARPSTSGPDRRRGDALRSARGPGPPTALDARRASGKVAIRL